MKPPLDVKRLAVSLSVIPAVAYAVVVPASVLLVGVRTTRSWQAAFMGIGWETIAGYEVGLLVIALLAWAIALIVGAASNVVRRRAKNEAGKVSPPARRWPIRKLWTFRLLAACLLLPALALTILRASAPFLSAEGFQGSLGLGGQAHADSAVPVNLGAPINTAYREAEPSFTADGRTMYFNCRSGDICVSHLLGTWETGTWTAPERLGPPISTEYEEVEPLINAAGDKLYITSSRPTGLLSGLPLLSPQVSVLRVINMLAMSKLGRALFGGLGLQNIYVSYYVNGEWTSPQSLNDVAGEPQVNTPFEDHCLFFSSDGKEAFWTSTRPGGLGDNDIWTSQWMEDGWTEPRNLGPNVNGPGSEHTSIPTPDGRSLYVTSDRPKGYGGDDIYLTTRGAEGTWGPLVNLGPLVNGPGDDRCPAWTPDGKIFLFDSDREGGFGGRDIWRISFEDVLAHSPQAGSSSVKGSLVGTR